MRKMIYKTISCVLLFAILLTSGYAMPLAWADETDVAGNEAPVEGMEADPAIEGGTRPEDTGEATGPDTIDSDLSGENNETSVEGLETNPDAEGGTQPAGTDTAYGEELIGTLAGDFKTLINVPTATGTLPVIDGTIGEEEWDQAAQSRSFYEYGPGTLIPESTGFKVLFSEDTLYLMVRCEQPEPPKAEFTAHDSAVYAEESVEVYFQPERGGNYYHFIVNAIGTTYEAVGQDNGWGGDGSGWQSKVTPYADGFWAVEIALPAGLFGLTEFADGEHGLNVCRAQLMENGKKENWGDYVRSTWSPYASGTWHDPSQFGVLTKGHNVYVEVKGNSFTIAEGLVTDVTLVNKHTAPLSMECHQEVTTPSGKTEIYNEIVAVPAGESREVRLKTVLEESGLYETGYLQITEQSTGAPLYYRNLKLRIGVPYPIQTKCYWFEENRVIVLQEPKDAMPGFDSTSGRFRLYKGDTLMQEEQAVMENGVWTAGFSFAGYEPGDYLIKVALFDGDNIIEATDGSLVYKPEEPEWWDSQLGKEDIVLPPWTGIKLSANTVSTWGREYHFGGSPFVSQIKTQGSDILADPVEISGQADGQALSFYEMGESYEEKSDTRLSYVNTSESDAVRLTVKSTVEYDGFVRFDVSLSSEEPVELQDLKVTIPFKPEFATLFDADPTDTPFEGTYPHWSGGDNGLFPDNAEGKFTPHIFIGNDKVGLVWVAESTKNWSFKDGNKVLSLHKKADVHTLEMNVVDKSIIVSPDEPLEFTFALQATPVKPESENPSFAMYGWYEMGSDTVRAEMAPNNGRLTYPAKDYITLEKGELSVRVAADQDLVSLYHTRHCGDDPRGDSPIPVVAVQFPDQNGFGLYFSLHNQTLRLRAFTTQNEGQKVHLDQGFVGWWYKYNPPHYQYHDLKLKWENGQIEVWVDGTKTLEGALNPDLFNTGIQEAQIIFGSNFVFDNFSNGEKTVECNDASVTGRELSGDWSETDNGDIRVALHMAPYRTALEVPRASGAQLVHIHETWTESQGYPMTNNPATRQKLKQLADECNDLGMQLLPYLGSQQGDNTEEYKNYHDDFIVEPFKSINNWNRGDHTGIYFTNVGRFQNFMLWSIEKLMKEDGIGGVYMDNNCVPPRSANLHNGTGYYDRDGVLQGSHPIFEYRNFFKRLRTMANAYRPDFWMDMHTQNGAWTPVSGFGDSLWKGEQLLMVPNREQDVRKLVQLDTLRAGMGLQTGLPSHFLNYTQIEESLAICSLLNIPVRLDGELINKVKKYYGLIGKDFVPYHAGGITSSAGEIAPMSYFKRQDGVVVAVTANLSMEEQPAEVTYALPEGLILSGSIATDAINGDNMALSGNTLTVHFQKSWRYKYILLAPEAVEEPVKYPFEWPHIGFPDKN